MTAAIAELVDRGVVSVTGPDATGFLQGLVTSDVERLRPGEAGYGALLTPQGKILFDFLIVRRDDGFLLDTRRATAPALAKRLGFYKLRAKVDIADRSESLAVLVAWGDGLPAMPGAAADDPRLPGLGRRTIVAAEEATGILAAAGSGRSDAAAWHAHRIALGVPEGDVDFPYGDSFPHDADMDDLAGVDFAKGCYVGQEVVSRMKHRGTARRRIIPVTGVGADALPPAGTEIVAGGKALGTLGSSAGSQGLALVRIDRVREALDAGLPVTAGDIALEPRLPAFARFGWPAGAAAD